MKSLARSYFWWPSMDKDIEEFVKKCEICLSCRPKPVSASPTKWPDVDGPFDRIHLDFLFLQKKDFLIPMVVFSK